MTADLVDAARQAAHLAGELIAAGDASRGKAKGAGDYVTDTDVACERAIEASLLGATGIPVVGEEAAASGETGDRYWLVDPIDGTTNFMHGFPAVGVSIALIEDGGPVVGVVHAPFLGETYSASRGEGAWLARAHNPPFRLSVSERPSERAVVATGFPFRRKELIPRHLRVVEACLQRCEDLRRPGAASLDLAWVAAGVFEGFFELNLSSWDVAAGALLVEEAGGLVSDWSGGPDYLSGNIIAGNPATHAVLVEIAEEGTDTGSAPSPA